MAKTHTVSIYLLKEGIRSAGAALKEDVGDLTEHRVSAGDTLGTLFVGAGEPTHPAWVDFLTPVTEPPVDYRSRSLSAVLFLEASGRWFAVTFGYGRRLLDPDSYERDFGLLCSLNAVDPAKLRGAEARTFDDYALHTLRQLSRLSTVGSLELNTDRELVVALAGQIEDPELGKRIDGRDAARITDELTPAELCEKCSELLRMSRKTKYRKHFPFFDKIKRVRDPATLQQLEKKVLETLGKQQFESFDLFPPQILSEEMVTFDFSGPRVPRTRVIEPDSRLLRYAVRGPQSMQEVRSRLDRLHLRGLDANGEVVEEWPFFRCLHWEHADGSSVYVLDGGDWYRIDSSFVSDVESFASELRSSSIEWPGATEKQREDSYNAAAARTLGCALMDKRLVRLRKQTGIEACDLFTADRQFVHVKHRKGGSGPLSHLFSQAVVSAESFVLEPEFRALLATELDGAKKGYGTYSPEQVDPRDYQVVLALIAKRPAKGNIAEALPFFSKVTLRLAVRHLTSMGFQVLLDVIPIQSPVPKPKSKGPVRAAPAGAKAASAATQRDSLPTRS